MVAISQAPFTLVLLGYFQTIVSLHAEPTYAVTNFTIEMHAQSDARQKKCCLSEHILNLLRVRRWYFKCWRRQKHCCHKGRARSWACTLCAGGGSFYSVHGVSDFRTSRTKCLALLSFRSSQFFPVTQEQSFALLSQLFLICWRSPSSDNRERLQWCIFFAVAVAKSYGQ